MDTEQTDLTLERGLGTLRRRAPWIVLCIMLVAGAAYGFTKHRPKKYTATAVLIFSSNQLGQQIAGLPGTGSNETSQVQQSTNMRLLRLGDVAAKTARRLDHGLTAGQV